MTVQNTLVVRDRVVICADINFTLIVEKADPAVIVKEDGDAPVKRLVSFEVKREVL